MASSIIVACQGVIDRLPLKGLRKGDASGLRESGIKSRDSGLWLNAEIVRDRVVALIGSHITPEFLPNACY